MITESIGTVRADECKSELGKQFQWWFQKPERPIFRLWFPSQVRLCVLTNPGVIWGSIVSDGFWVGSYSAFGDDFQSIGTVCADESRLHLWRQCRWWFLSRQRLSFRWWISESSGTVCVAQSRRQLWKKFRWQFPNQLGLRALTNLGVRCRGSLGDDFWVIGYSLFGDDYRVNRDSARRRILASVGEAVSEKISDPWAT